MKAWQYVTMIDHDEVGGSSCFFCGRPIRYEHVIQSRNGKQVGVGVMCADHATDTDTASRKERRAKNIARVRMNFPRRKWKLSQNGNFFLNIRASNSRFIIKRRGRCFVGMWFALTNKGFTDMKNTFEEAALAIFDIAVSEGWKP